MESERIEFQTLDGVTLRGDLFGAGKDGTQVVTIDNRLACTFTLH